VTRWYIWTVYIVLWTGLLVMPGPVQEQLPLGEFSFLREFVVAKGLHVVGYATLAILTGALRLPPNGRLLFLGILMFHAGLTEFVQQFVERGASVNDVVLDHLAIGLGCVLSWKWWTQA
jgi:hypothetical protein